MPIKRRAKVIVIKVNKKGLLIHFSFPCHYTKFATENIILKLSPVYTNFVFPLLVSLITVNTTAQILPQINYPQNYFTWPVTAIKSISANYGELRPNHYHMGIDFRTDKKQNMQVMAAADGYIAKVKIEPSGFGRSISINHPNGLTTLYAHLNDFYPELEKYIKEQQYTLKSWAVTLDIPENLFPVKKEMFIAFSGNTGGSQGPHLHFEIRDTKTDKVLNPSLFGFPIPDNVAPDVYRLAIYDRNISTYEQIPKICMTKKVNGVYVTTPSAIVINTNKISFGISTSDRLNGSTNRNGIYETVLYENDNPIIGFQLNSISYDETRYSNAHIDYKLKNGGGPFVEHLSKLPGYVNSIYWPVHTDGVIAINDDSIHKIKIEVKDVNGNTSTVRFDIKRNFEKLELHKTDSTAFVQQNEFHPGFVNIFENSNISLYLPENCLYDSIRFRYTEQPAKKGYTIYQLHNTSVPLQGYFPVTIKASTALPDKMVMHRFANGKDDYAKADPVKNGKENGWYRASFREFGNFQLMIDTIPPTITPIGFKNGINSINQKRIIFIIKDNTEKIKNFSATLDGNWLRFSNDKGRTFIYDFDEMCPAGEHELKIIAEDQTGNVTQKVYHFTR